MEVNISLTDVPPFMDYITDMATVVSYLRFKSNLSELEKRMIANHDAFVEQLENEPNKEFSKPYLKLLRQEDG